MTRPVRFLGDGDSPENATGANPNSTSPAASDFVLILAALLCTLICVLGLMAVARCALHLRDSPSNPQDSKANRGLKKKVLQSLPRLTLSPYSASGFPDCAICLSELSAGDEIRVLLPCGHAFHLGCVDIWLRSHSSCPSCRQILSVPAAPRHGKMRGSSSEAASSSGDGGGAQPEGVDEARLRHREDDNRFLP
ncbi:hypothetical protein SAY87_021876 [Trapa incisa]|uniref:RING-type domain-containing protein n=1 Tax=Trapa incisa TaxID=236973 RepID=A0AAN7PSX1_9MYRT|nr:hypothetical protein SAY87_021876 [Trapa incisa]